MKTVFISLFILLCFFCDGQGLKLTGQVFTDNSTHYHIDSLFTYPNYYYSSVDSTVNLVMQFSISQTDAKNKNYIVNSYQLPISNFYFKSSTGYPTSTSLYNYIKPILQAAPYNFTVTTF